jgi:hypothetical protein
MDCINRVAIVVNDWVVQKIPVGCFIKKIKKKRKTQICVSLFFGSVKRSGEAVTENFSLKLKEKKVPSSGS